MGNWRALKMLPNSKRSLLYVAKARLQLGEDDFRALLANYGGVTSTRNLDPRGFDAVMDRLRALGFTSTARQKNFGDRTGMASPAQVAKIRTLWADAVDEPTERSLDRFLSKRCGVSSLRFVDSGRAPRVITALKAMVERRKAAHAD